MTNPYGQQPYGTPGQQPYGAPSGGMPVAPQGQPPQGQPPHGQPPQGQPFYGQQPYGHQPYGQPVGAQPYGAPGMAGPYVGPDIPDYKGWAVGSIFLFLIVGIFALMKSNEVSSYKIQGNLPAAQEASRQARSLCLIATIVGASAWVLSIIWMIVVLASVPDVPTYGY